MAFYNKRQKPGVTWFLSRSLLFHFFFKLVMKRKAVLIHQTSVQPKKGRCTQPPSVPSQSKVWFFFSSPLEFLAWGELIFSFIGFQPRANTSPSSGWYSLKPDPSFHSIAKLGLSFISGSRITLWFPCFWWLVLIIFLFIPWLFFVHHRSGRYWQWRKRWSFSFNFLQSFTSWEWQSESRRSKPDSCCQERKKKRSDKIHRWRSWSTSWCCGHHPSSSWPRLGEGRKCIFSLFT